MNKILLALAALAVVTVNSQATEQVATPDATGAMPLLGIGLGCLAVAKSYFSKRK